MFFTQNWDANMETSTIWGSSNDIKLPKNDLESYKKCTSPENLCSHDVI